MTSHAQAALPCYDKALKLRPKWKEARDNRDLVAARAKLLNDQGGDAGDQLLGADKIVFDKKKSGGQDTNVAGEKAASDAVVQSMWLRRVQTKLADFLKSKFAYQLSIEKQKEPGNELAAFDSSRIASPVGVPAAGGLC